MCSTSMYLPPVFLIRNQYDFGGYHIEDSKKEKKGSSSLIIVVGEAKAGQVKQGWVGLDLV